MRADFIYHSKFKRNIPIIVFGILFAVGFYLRFDGISARGLEYDEIWTYTRYSSESVAHIFTELSTPNNHPLNSLFVKLTTSVFGANSLSMRFPAFISGVFLLLLVFALAKKVFYSRLAAILACALVSFNGALIHFSQTSRGYEMQCLFLMLFITGLFFLNGASSRGEKFLWGLLMTLGAALSVLTLPTSILFIFPVSGIYYVWKSYGKNDILWLFRRNNCAVLVSFTVIALFCLFWYGINYHKFLEGKSNFGKHCGSFLEASGMYSDVIFKLLPPWVCALPLLFLIRKKSRKLFFTNLALVLFPFACIPFVSLGPPRVYLPLVPIWAVFAGGAASEFFKMASLKLKLRCLKGIMALAFIAASFMNIENDLNKWMPIDWKISYPQIIKMFSENVFICFSPTDTLSVIYNCDSSLKDNRNRIACMGNFFLNVNNPGKISGTLSKLNGKPETIELSPLKPIKSFKLFNAPLELYALEKPKDSNFKKNRIFLALIKPGKESVVRNYYSAVANSGSWVLLNCFFNSSSLRSRDVPMGYVLAIKLEKLSFSLEDLKAIELNSGKKIEFFCLKGVQ